jgi:hypothetical protein
VRFGQGFATATTFVRSSPISWVLISNVFLTKRISRVILELAGLIVLSWHKFKIGQRVEYSPPRGNYLPMRTARVFLLAAAQAVSTIVEAEPLVRLKPAPSISARVMPHAFGSNRMMPPR